ncbi:hypothetical protein BaRGS_00006734, partial [Batillaria attramentaria]
PGSIGVDYNVEYNHSAVSQPKVLRSELDNVKNTLQSEPTVDIGYLNKTFLGKFEENIQLLSAVDKNPCASPSACPAYHSCTYYRDKEEFQCISPCIRLQCTNGHCQLDSDGKPECKCPKDEKYVYGGDKCEQMAEKLDLSSTTIIAIAAGAGGGLICILTIALVVTCCWRKGRDKERDADRKSEVSFQSISDAKGVSPNHNGGPSDAMRLHRQPHHSDHPPYLRHDSGLPAEDVQERADFRFSFSGQRETTMGGRGEDIRYGNDGRLYHVVKQSQLHPESHQPVGPHAFRNQAFDASHDEQEILRERRMSQSHYGRQANRPDSPRFESSMSQQDSSRYVPLGGRSQSPRSTLDSSGYSKIDDETVIYQPTAGQQPNPRRSSVSNPNRSVYNVDPAELSGFPRQEEPRSGHHDDMHRDAPRRRSSDTRYPAWADSPYARVHKHPKPEAGRDERVPATAVFDFSDRAPEASRRDSLIGQSSHSHHDNRTDRQPGAARAHVYDYIPDEKVGILRFRDRIRVLRNEVDFFKKLFKD